MERTHPLASLRWYPSSPPSAACTLPILPPSTPASARHHQRALQHLPRQRHHYQGLRHRARHLVDLGIATRARAPLLPFSIRLRIKVSALSVLGSILPGTVTISAVLACLLCDSLVERLYCNRSVSCSDCQVSLAALCTRFTHSFACCRDRDYCNPVIQLMP